MEMNPMRNEDQNEWIIQSLEVLSPANPRITPHPERKRFTKEMSHTQTHPYKPIQPTGVKMTEPADVDTTRRNHTCQENSFVTSENLGDGKKYRPQQ